VSAYRSLQLPVVISIYGSLALVAGLWDWLSRGHFFYSFKESSIGSPWAWFLSFLFVVLYFFISIALTRWTDWGRTLDTVFSRILTPISYLQILILALLSGIVEEWFFRGVLLSHFGIVLSSILFGLCHLIPQPKIWVWSVWSLAMGLFFGLVYRTTESLWICIFIHTMINFSLILYLNLRAYQEPQMAD